MCGMTRKLYLKSVWRLFDSDPDVAGYVKQAGLVTQAVMRGAGHMVPFDQPERALDLLDICGFTTRNLKILLIQ